MPEIVQPVSAVPIDPVESSTNITFIGVPWPPALAAAEVEARENDGKPKAFRKWVDTLPVWVTLTAFGSVPEQLGRLAVAVTQLSVVVVFVIVTFAGTFAVVHAVTAAATVVCVAPVCSSAWAPASEAASVAAVRALLAANTRATSTVSPTVPNRPVATTANSTAVAPRRLRRTLMIFILSSSLNHLRRLRPEGAAVRRVVDAHDGQVAGIGGPHDRRGARHERRRAARVVRARRAVDRDGRRDARGRQVGRRSGDRRDGRGVGSGRAPPQRHRERAFGGGVGEDEVGVHRAAELEDAQQDGDQHRRDDREFDRGDAGAVFQQAGETQ